MSGSNEALSGDESARMSEADYTEFIGHYPPETAITINGKQTTLGFVMAAEELCPVPEEVRSDMDRRAAYFAGGLATAGSIRPEHVRYVPVPKDVEAIKHDTDKDDPPTPTPPSSDGKTESVTKTSNVPEIPSGPAIVMQTAAETVVAPPSQFEAEPDKIMTTTGLPVIEGISQEQSVDILLTPKVAVAETVPPDESLFIEQPYVAAVTVVAENFTLLERVVVGRQGNFDKTFIMPTVGDVLERPLVSKRAEAVTPIVVPETTLSREITSMTLPEVLAPETVNYGVLIERDGVLALYPTEQSLVDPDIQTPDYDYVPPLVSEYPVVPAAYAEVQATPTVYEDIVDMPEPMLVEVQRAVLNSSPQELVKSLIHALASEPERPDLDNDIPYLAMTVESVRPEDTPLTPLIAAIETIDEEQITAIETLVEAFKLQIEATPTEIEQYSNELCNVIALVLQIEATIEVREQIMRSFVFVAQIINVDHAELNDNVEENVGTRERKLFRRLAPDDSSSRHDGVRQPLGILATFHARLRPA